MFSYCLNNPAIYYDSDGKDAIWIQEYNSAHGQGHSGLMIQNEEGLWYYFYWGPSSTDEDAEDIGSLIAGVKNDCYFVPVDVVGLDLTRTDDVIKAMESAGGKVAARLYQTDGSKTQFAIHYFSGDYVASFTEASRYAGLDKDDPANYYKLLSQNCSQVSLSCMLESDYRFAWVINGYQSCAHPNTTFSRVSFLPKDKNDFWGNLFAQLSLGGAAFGGLC